MMAKTEVMLTTACHQSHGKDPKTLISRVRIMIWTRGGKTRIRKMIQPFPTLTTTLTRCRWMDQQRQQSLFYMMRLGQHLLNICHLATLNQPNSHPHPATYSTGQCHIWCCHCHTSPQLNKHVPSCTTC
jgi:hypothetical protein